MVANAFLLHSSIASAKEKVKEQITVQGEGEAKIINENLGQARKRALDDAMQKAFENALIEIMPIGYSLDMEQDLIDELAAMKRQFLLQYRILAEMPAFEDFFVNIEATFSVPLIMQTLTEKGLIGIEEESVSTITVNIRVKGVSFFSWYQMFFEALQKEVPLVESVALSEVFGTTMVLTVKYQGTGTDRLVSGISALSPMEFEINVDEVKDNDIILSFRSLSGWIGLPAAPSDQGVPLAPPAP